MRSLKKFVNEFVRREDGPTAVEYAVMLALIIVVCITAITTLGKNANNTFVNVGNANGLGKPPGPVDNPFAKSQKLRQAFALAVNPFDIGDRSLRETFLHNLENMDVWTDRIAARPVWSLPDGPYPV